MATPTEDKRKRDDEEASASASPVKKAKVTAAKPEWLTDAMVEGFRDGDQDMEDVVKAITKAFRKTPDSKKFAKLEDELAKAQAYLQTVTTDEKELQSLFDSVYDDSSIIPKKWRDDYGLDDY